MIKKIAILGSTGSIGKSTIDIIRKDKKNFKITLLSTNKNIRLILNQAREFNVKNIIITSKKHFLKLKKINKNKNLKIYNNFDHLNKIFKKKIDYIMSSITGLPGLKPTLLSIKYTKIIAIANKESIICGWNLLNIQLKKHKTKFIPVDSEHFSIWSLMQNESIKKVEKIIITASGGPFLNYKSAKLKNVNPKIAIKHPNWSMGKKISIDSATLMNKVFEIIEAQRIFSIDIKKFEIIVHPKSYVHSIIKFINGQIKILAHDTDMKIPIFNSIYQDKIKKIITKKIDLTKLNNLNLSTPSIKKFPSLKILKNITNNNTLFETVIISANDHLVNDFLKGKIKFVEITKFLLKILNMKEFNKYKYIKPRNLRQILSLIKFVRLKANQLYIK